MEYNKLTSHIIGCAVRIHKNTGPGLLESVYENLLAYEIRKLGLAAWQQVKAPLIYDDHEFETAFKIDILVESKIIIEVKSVEDIAPVHKAQLLTYLKLTKLKLGLLINFNTSVLKHGIVRMVNGL